MSSQLAPGAPKPFGSTTQNPNSNGPMHQPPSFGPHPGSSSDPQIMSIGHSNVQQHTHPGVTLPVHHAPLFANLPSSSGAFFPNRNQPARPTPSLIPNQSEPWHSRDLPPIPPPSPSVDSTMSDGSNDTITPTHTSDAGQTAGSGQYMSPTHSGSAPLSQQQTISFPSQSLNAQHAPSLPAPASHPSHIPPNQPLGSNAQFHDPSNNPSAHQNGSAPYDPNVGTSVPPSFSQPHQTAPEPNVQAGPSGSSSNQDCALPSDQGNQGASSSSNKGKEKELDPTELLREIADSFNRRQKGTGKRSETLSNKVTKKSPGEPYRLVKEDLDYNQKKLLVCLFLWVRILWGLLTVDQCPTIPLPADLDVFDSRFSTKREVEQARSSAPLIDPRLVSLTSRVELIARRRKNSTSVHATTIPETNFDHMRVLLSQFGLKHWRVHLASTPDSLYNKACELIVLDSFRQAILSGAFKHMDYPSKLASSRDLHQRLYYHVVFHYFYGIWTSEQSSPGRNRTRNETNAIIKNRLRFLVDNGYPERYQILADPKATSDDEYDPSTEEFEVKKRPERSQAAVIWYRHLDEVMGLGGQFKRSKRRPQHAPLVQKPTVLQMYPTGMPLDYFHPEYYNQLPVHARKLAVLGGENEDNKLKGKLRLPFLEDPRLSFATQDAQIEFMEKKMSDEKFFSERFMKVLGSYALNGEYDSDVEMS
ncbi:hypothetical protein E1B28_006906 [Marasmius oreades]|uniref:Uncharacterized protein n=1 Tax=Marasmius oreades TaxID=181124 RepID=A0A9P7S187_9AGAR|nr:uncharacterized protein E1B28_006906 [Marasmius oreades]KAG7093220.1 hypothetical protein E1B28_006906 [Marasmius oreades]